MRGEGPTQIKLNIQSCRPNAENTKKLRTNSEQKLLDKIIELKANVLLCEQPLDESLKDKLLLQGFLLLKELTKKIRRQSLRLLAPKLLGN